MSPMSVQQVSAYVGLHSGVPRQAIFRRIELLLHFLLSVCTTCITTPSISAQVDEEGLVDTLRKFLTDETCLDERRAAAEGALTAGASGVIARVWELLESCILKESLI